MTLYNFVDFAVNFQLVTNNGHQTVSDDCSIHLDLESIDARTLKGFDFQMLFHPFEEQFYLPELLIKQCFFSCFKYGVVRDKDQLHIDDFVIVFDPPKLPRIMFA